MAPPSLSSLISSPTPCFILFFIFSIYSPFKKYLKYIHVFPWPWHHPASSLSRTSQLASSCIQNKDQTFYQGLEALVSCPCPLQNLTSTPQHSLPCVMLTLVFDPPSLRHFLHLELSLPILCIAGCFSSFRAEPK